MHDNLAAHLIALELRLQDPEIRRDPAAVAGLLSADFCEFGASGRIWQRAELLQALSSESSVEFTSENFSCRPLSNELALLTYLCSSPTRKTLRSSLWRLEEGNWRILFHQGTVIP